MLVKHKIKDHNEKIQTMRKKREIIFIINDYGLTLGNGIGSATAGHAHINMLLHIYTPVYIQINMYNSTLECGKLLLRFINDSGEGLVASATLTLT